MINFDTYESYYKYYCKQNNVPINKKFINWVNKVERIIVDALFVDNLLDLPDEMYFENFESGMTVHQMAQMIIENN